MSDATVDTESGMEISYDLPPDAPESVRQAAATVAQDAITTAAARYATVRRRANGLHNDLEAIVDAEAKTVAVRLKCYPDGKAICRWRGEGRSKRMDRVKGQAAAVADLNAMLREPF